MSSKVQIVNLLIILVAIFLISAAKTKFSELFVAQVPNVPNYNGSPSPIQGGYPQGNPRIYENQIYPARIPYYNEMGNKCNSIKDCGSMGMCKDGSCKAIPYENTVFNIKT